MRTVQALRRFAAEIVATSPRNAAASVALTVTMSLTEGMSLLLLMPLLALVGVNDPNTMPNVAGWFEAGFALIGVRPTLGTVLALFVAIAGVRALLQQWQAALSAVLQETFSSSMRVRVYRAMARADWNFLVARRPSEFVHVLTTEIGRLGVAAFQVVDLAVVLTVAVVYLGMAFHFSAIMAALVLSCTALLARVMRGSLEAARRSGANATAARGGLHAAIAEHVGSLKTARAYGVVGRHAASFERLSRELRDVNVKLSAGETDFQQSLEFGTMALLALIVYVAFELVGVPAAQLLVLLFIFARLMPRLVTIYRRVQTLVSALPTLEAVKALERQCLQAAEADDEAEHHLSFERGIRLEDVSFHYAGRADAPSLSAISLDIPAGLTTAIVGPSGAGKSTLADLIIGLLSPTTGSVLVDGKTLRTDQLADWRHHISYVSQDTFLFHESIRANLAWVRPDSDDDQLWHALDLAAADFVRALPEGLDTVVGERGVLLSGGERQRLSLARALMRQPRILVLDEATSSLDSESELRIQQAIERLHQQMTIVIITHRLSTIRHADLIYVLEHGRVVESGSWSSLLTREGRFRDLCQAQGIGDLLGRSPGEGAGEAADVLTAGVEATGVAATGSLSMNAFRS